MRSSLFNARVPIPDRDETFLLNTMTDARVLVSNDVVDLLDAVDTNGIAEELDADQRETLDELAQHGFVVPSRELERRGLEEYLARGREDTDELEVTFLTTLQCNFACDYCIQGDHGDHNKFAHSMSMETAQGVYEWIVDRLNEIRPKTFLLRFFGGEPLLNLPVMYELSERLWRTTRERNIGLRINVVTNGLLLTPEVVDRLKPVGLSGIKITLDGDKTTHDRMRPLRGGQGTFDKIVENIRRVAHRVPIAIGGNFDESSVESLPSLLDFLQSEDFADSLVQVAFKPIVRPPAPETPAGFIPLTVVDGGGKPLGGSCMTGAGAGGAVCDTCGLLDDKIAFLREETKKRGLPHEDGLHMGPCEIHRQHSYTIDPDGALYACPGFASETHQATGHIDGRIDPTLQRSAAKFAVLDAWRECGDCAFIPVCAGGCSVAANAEEGGIHKPSCHKASIESAVETLAFEAVAQ